MDSLIVLRKPLRKSHLVPKFTIPKKSKKAVPKVESIPLDPDLEDAESTRSPAISFVKLYKELCLQRARQARRPGEPARHVTTPAERPARSDTSLVTQYAAPPGPRPELVLELDYRTSFVDSGFA